jgi:predicted secreted acid phosphatase
MALTVPGLAIADHGHQSVPAPPEHPTSASQIQNIDQVKTAIKAYYGDTVTTTVDPVPNSVDGGDVALHQFDPDGAYAHEVKGIARAAGKYLANHHKRTENKSIIFDIDDTTLNTYSYEIYSNFVYNPATNADFVNAGVNGFDSTKVFPAVPGMVDLEKKAMRNGYQVFWLTGRPATQLAGTLANLRADGYTVDESHVYLKDLSAPYLQWCMTDSNGKPCTTIEYKSSTRKYIESQGYELVANFGDQFSDLKGGFADRTFKIPNPMYYLP